MASPFFSWLQHTSPALAVAHSNHLVGAGLQIVHVVGLILLLACATLVNLRVFGIGLRSQPGDTIARETGRLLWIGLALAAVSGSLIFVSGAVRYVENAAFDIKVACLAAAILLQLVALRALAATPADSAGVFRSRSLAVLSALAWLGTAGAGRAIGYI